MLPALDGVSLEPLRQPGSASCCPLDGVSLDLGRPALRKGTPARQDVASRFLGAPDDGSEERTKFVNSRLVGDHFKPLQDAVKRMHDYAKSILGQDEVPLTTNEPMKEIVIAGDRLGNYREWRTFRQRLHTEIRVSHMGSFSGELIASKEMFPRT